MLSQFNKKIYIINFNPNDFFDLTIEALEILQSTDFIILSKIVGEDFKSNLNMINKNFEVNTNLSFNEEDTLRYLLKKLKKYNSVSLCKYDPLCFHSSLFNDKLFESQKVSIELKLGVLPTVNLLNKNNDLITNRNKNSSVTFYNLIDPNNLIQIIKKKQFEKLIIGTHGIAKTKKFIDSLENVKKLGINYYIYDELNKIDLNVFSKKNDNDKLFIVVEVI